MKRIVLASLLAGLLIGLGGVIALRAYTDGSATKFSDGVGTVGDVRVLDIRLDGNDVLDSNGTTRLTIGATNTLVGNVSTTSGSFVVFSATAPRTGSVVSALTIAAGMMFFNSTQGGLCHATGTVQTSIVTTTAPTTACGN